MGITEEEIRARIRSIPDFPQKGIMFRDLTPLLKDGLAFQRVVQELANRFGGQRPDAVLGIEARGFILGGALAFLLGVAFIPARKVGKLPWRTTRENYTLEYGVQGLEVHVDAVGKGERVLIVDDLLATGGTAAAAARLVEKLGGRVLGVGFLVELLYLHGRERLRDYDVASLCRYESE